MSSRNLAIDLCRGFALLVIFVNHMPLNPLFFYTPSRFGFSDAAEILVFCSGVACAYAYHRFFVRGGMRLGLLRILQRAMQLYVVHVGMFLLLATLAARVNPLLPDWDLLGDFSLNYFFEHTYAALEELMTLTYVPNFFDILPLYIVMLMYVPVIVWLQARAGWLAVVVLSASIYAGAWLFGWELTADRLQVRHWYFNPFCWQLLFVIGYGAGAGWFPKPEMRKRAFNSGIVLLLLAIPLSWPPLRWYSSYLQDARSLLEPWLDKSHLGLLRIVYFLVLANVVRVILLRCQSVYSHRAFAVLIVMGQQSLPVFFAGTLLSFAGGIVLYQHSQHPLAVVIVNVAGAWLLWLVARLACWIKSAPQLLSEKATSAANYGAAQLSAG